MNESASARCADIFRIIAGLEDSPAHVGWSDERLLAEPLEALGVDSLTLLEFVMTVEDSFHVELDEDAVNGCTKLQDLVVLVDAARAGGHGTGPV